MQQKRVIIIFGIILVIALVLQSANLLGLLKWLVAGDAFNQGVVSALTDNYIEAIDYYTNATRHPAFAPRAYFNRCKVRAANLGHQNYACIGIQINQDSNDEELIVTEVYEDTPAWQAGLKKGDRIQMIDGQSTSDMSLTQAIDMIRGEAGTQVKLKVIRSGSGNKNINFEITRISAIDSPNVKFGDYEGTRKDCELAIKLFREQGEIVKSQEVKTFIKKNLPP